MYDNGKIYSGFSVDDSSKAKQFYSEILGLDVQPVEGMEDMGMHVITTKGNNPIFMYPKPDHAPASFTILNFPVDDIEQAVADLKAKGVTFERVEGIEQDEQGIMRGKQMQMGPDIAWFRDPAGNSLAIMED